MDGNFSDTDAMVDHRPDSNEARKKVEDATGEDSDSAHGDDALGYGADANGTLFDGRDSDGVDYKDTETESNTGAGGDDHRDLKKFEKNKQTIRGGERIRHCVQNGIKDDEALAETGMVLAYKNPNDQRSTTALRCNKMVSDDDSAGSFKKVT